MLLELGGKLLIEEHNESGYIWQYLAVDNYGGGVHVLGVVRGKVCSQLL
jgi:hypothetical protein